MKYSGLVRLLSVGAATAWLSASPALAQAIGGAGGLTEVEIEADLAELPPLSAVESRAAAAPPVEDEEAVAAELADRDPDALEADPQNVGTNADEAAPDLAGVDGPTASRDGVEMSGAIALGARVFAQPGSLPGQEEGQLFPFLSGWGKFVVNWNDGRERVVVQPFARYDLRTDRDLFDLPEAYYYRQEDWGNVLVGSHIVFWGVTESRHLVNIVNQIDRTGDIDEEDRLGQPMVNVNIQGGEMGTLSLFGLFGFREQDFPSAKDRLRVLPLVAEDQAIVEDDDLARHVAFAARYFNTFDVGIGSLDFAVSYFNGTGRDPRLVPQLLPTGDTILIPFYDHIQQVGTEALLVVDNLQLKYEGIWRRQFDEDIFAAVGGFEYTFPGVFGTAVDVGILGEYLYDDRSPLQPPVTGDNDVFGGIRMTFNNVLNTNLLAGVTYDLDSGATFGSVELLTRLRDDVSLSVEGRLFANLPQSDPTVAFEDEDYLEVKVIKYF